MVFLCYAIVAGLAGVLLIAWGPIWFGAHLPGLTWGKAALIRILGALFVAAACFAAAMVRVDDPVARCHALAWAAAAHGVLGVVVDMQRVAVLREWLPSWVSAIAMLAFPILFFAWWQAWQLRIIVSNCG